MDLRQIRYFIRIAELGSFSKAAAHLNVAQPALSRHVQSLEAEFGTKLLARTTRGVAPTEAGQVLIEHGTNLLKGAVDLHDAVRLTARGTSGDVSVGLPPSVSGLVVQDLIDHCRVAFPEVRLRVVEGVSMFLEEWLDRGGLDLAIVTESASSRRFDTTALFAEDFFLVGRLSAFSASRTSVNGAELADLDLVMTHGFRQIVSEQLGPDVLSGTAEVDSLTVIRDMINTSTVATVLPQSLVQREGWVSRLRVMSFEGRAPRRSLVVAANPRRPHSAAAQAVRKALVSRIQSRTSGRAPERRVSAALS